MDEASIYVTFAFFLLMAAGCVAVGIATGFPAAHWFGQKVANFLSFLPLEKFDKPQPAYGIAASKAIRGDLTGAMESYEQLLLEHPQDKQLYMRMLEIALGPLRSPEYAEDILNRGMEALPHEADRVAIASHGEALRKGEFKPFKYLEPSRGTR